MVSSWGGASVVVAEPEAFERLPAGIALGRGAIASHVVPVRPADRAQALAVGAAQREPVGLEEDPVADLLVDLDPRRAALDPDDVVVAGIVGPLRVAARLLVHHAEPLV